jgi:hypothetical protein
MGHCVLQGLLGTRDLGPGVRTTAPVFKWEVLAGGLAVWVALFFVKFKTQIQDKGLRAWC